MSKGPPLMWNYRSPPRPFDENQYIPDTPTKAAWLSLKEECIRLGIIKQISPNQATHVAWAFLTEKELGYGFMKHWLVVDRRKVNQHLRHFGLRYERLRDFGHLACRNKWLVGFDLKNAYRHLCLRESE